MVDSNDHIWPVPEIERGRQQDLKMDHMFVLKPQISLQCMICSKVAKDPLQHESCGKLFCRLCLEKKGRDKPCHHCGKQGTQFYVDNKSKL